MDEGRRNFEERILIFLFIYFDLVNLCPIKTHTRVDSRSSVSGPAALKHGSVSTPPLSPVSLNCVVMVLLRGPSLGAGITFHRLLPVVPIAHFPRSHPGSGSKATSRSFDIIIQVLTVELDNELNFFSLEKKIKSSPHR